MTIPTPTWDELVYVVEKGDVYEYIKNYPKQWQKGIALALSVAKWLPSRGRWRGFGVCALCQVYYDDHAVFEDICAKCPLYIKTRLGCDDSDSLYLTWSKKEASPHYGERQVVKAANDMYNVLLELYTEEYNR